MFHEEAVVGGRLCHRGTPDGEWIPYTAEELTMIISELREKLKSLVPIM